VNAVKETKDLLKELKRDITAQNTDNEEERAKRIDDARRQLQKLLEIVSPSV
jgi:guanylate kinase